MLEGAHEAGLDASVGVEDSVDVEDSGYMEVTGKVCARGRPCSPRLSSLAGCIVTMVSDGRLRKRENLRFFSGKARPPAEAGYVVDMAEE